MVVKDFDVGKYIAWVASSRQRHQVKPAFDVSCSGYTWEEQYTLHLMRWLRDAWLSDRFDWESSSTLRPSCIESIGRRMFGTAAKMKGQGLTWDQASEHLREAMEHLEMYESERRTGL